MVGAHLPEQAATPERWLNGIARIFITSSLRCVLGQSRNAGSGREEATLFRKGKKPNREILTPAPTPPDSYVVFVHRIAVLSFILRAL